MGRILKVLGLVVLVLVAAGAAIYFSGNTLQVIVWLSKPARGWELSRKAPAPDYAQVSSWAARPGMASAAEFSPQGVANAPGERSIDVFFVHPTGFLSGKEWNSPLDP